MGWIVAVVLIILIVLVIVAFFAAKNKKKKGPIDYYTFFVTGIIWAIIGTLLKNFALFAIGVIFMAVGLSHKKEWKRNREVLRKLNYGKKRMSVWVLLILVLLLFLGFLLLYLRVKTI